MPQSHPPSCETLRLSCLFPSPSQELSRLWDWQHRRAALGLPPDLTPAEQQAAAHKAAVKAEKAAYGQALGDASAAQADGAGVAPSEAAPGPAAPKAVPPPPRPAAALPGILGIIQKAEKQQQEHEVVERQELVRVPC